jgi:hypothetical protein
VLDGVFAKDRAGALNFHPAPRLTALDVAEVLATPEPGIKRLLECRGLGNGDDDGAATDAWAMNHRCSPDWRRRVCRGPWRSGLIAALAFVAG